MEVDQVRFLVLQDLNLVNWSTMRNRNWCYTLNNYTEEEVTVLKSIDSTYHILGYEVGEKGTPHVQATIRFKNKKTLKQVKKLIPRAHLEVVKDMVASIEYCKKDGKYDEIGLYKNGRPSKEERIKKNKRLLDSSIPLMDLVEEGILSAHSINGIKKARLIIDQENTSYTHDDVRGEWYYGPPGTGKSRTARERYPDLYIKAQNKWFDGYRGETAILLDDLDTGTLGHYLKIWADRYACTGEVKGGTLNLCHRTFIVTSNWTPEELWPDNPKMAEAIERRFKKTHFSNFLKKKKE